MASAWYKDDDYSGKQKTINFDVAYGRYEEIRDRLPIARSISQSSITENLLTIAPLYDGYLFDSFGVLNVGETPVDGAAEVLQELRNLGKPFCVLTNAASYTCSDACIKYQKLGLDVRIEEILSSRDVLFHDIPNKVKLNAWSAIAAKDDFFSDTVVPVNQLIDDVQDWDTAEGILFLSSSRWSQSNQDRLVASLLRKPRPVLVGNPDLVAPRENGLTIEPGYWAHDLQDKTGILIKYYGKPYSLAFELAAKRMSTNNLVMIGDTLHTDILGGQAAGFDTALVTDHGLFKNKPIRSYIDASGIHPTWIMKSI